jgi:8-oxo-dGTP pyrophosphatase MutT (NUDIX family)
VRHHGDSDDFTTAVRETREEIGLELDGALGRMPAWLTRTHKNWMPMVVVPWVFHWQGPADCTLNHEVAEVFWVPIRALRDPDLTTSRSWKFAGKTWDMAGWDWKGRTIWGLTYHMLHSLLRQLDQ